MTAPRPQAPIERTSASVFVIPTDAPFESDGTLTWRHTTLVLVQIRAGGCDGLGYTYASGAASQVIAEVLAPAIHGLDAMAIPAAWAAMRRQVRNLGQPGIAFCAISAVDIALWDLKAKLLQLPLVTLLGAARASIQAYGSGGFTSYSETQLCSQLDAWVGAGCQAVKIKIGRDAQRDCERIRAARHAIGADTALFVDANGAYDRKLALRQAQRFADLGVRWFEEPVSSDDLAGLHALREGVAAGIDVAAGEYGYTPVYFQRMLEAEAVDVLQADATRCGGISGLLGVAALVGARSLQLSAHCAPSLHVHPGCALEPMRHVEYFHDHARIEAMLFEGAAELRDGALAPDCSRFGLGLTLKTADAARFAAT